MRALPHLDLSAVALWAVQDSLIGAACTVSSPHIRENWRGRKDQNSCDTIVHCILGDLVHREHCTRELNGAADFNNQRGGERGERVFFLGFETQSEVLLCRGLE